MSLIVPPATPVIVAKMIIPTMSALCSMALNAPVTAKTIVPKRSSAKIRIEIDGDSSVKSQLVVSYGK